MYLRCLCLLLIVFGFNFDLFDQKHNTNDVDNVAMEYSDKRINEILWLCMEFDDGQDIAYFTPEQMLTNIWINSQWIVIARWK